MGTGSRLQEAQSVPDPEQEMAGATGNGPERNDVSSRQGRTHFQRQSPPAQTEIFGQKLQVEGQ
jgi:hypothetical protein